MDGLKHPVGDQPANIYWRRRLFVIVAIVVLALFLWWAISALSSNSKTPGAAPTNTSTSTASPSPTVNADPSRTCTDADVTVVSGPENASFAGNKVPTFTITVTSIADTPCVVDPATASKIVITSGEDTWFDSSKCNGYEVFDAEKFVIEPQGTKELSTTWNKGRDDKGCSADQQAGTKGYYWFKATLQGIAADKLQFQLT